MQQEPSEYVEPSDDRPPKKKSRNEITNTQHIQRICSWGDCENIYEALKKRLPDADPWAGNPIQFICTRHLQAARNSLFRGTRYFTIGDVPFGWKAIVNCWKRDSKKNTNDASASLNEISVYPDGEYWPERKATE
jgi:hypothetical protein